MNKKNVFELKDDPLQTIAITREEVQEIVPDADFRFSLIILKNDRKVFVCGTKEEICKKLEIQ